MRSLLKYCYGALAILGMSCGSDSDDYFNPTGQGGSLARFAVHGDRLYVVGDEEILNYDISNPQNPEYLDSYLLGFDIETVVPKGDFLYIGAETGMHIFDISNPDKLVKLSTYRHIRSCDPVVVQGNTAYVSLRSGCGGGGLNLLELLNIEDPANPLKIGEYADIVSPHGLGIVGDYLYLCEGDYGLKILNVSDPDNIILEDALDLASYDVIVMSQQHLLVTGAEGIHQLDITQPTSPKLINTIPVVQ